MTSGTAAPWRFLPPRRSERTAASGDPAFVDEEEPEIVYLLMAHCRALLQLQRLTPAQRVRLSGLIAGYEARLSGLGDFPFPGPEQRYREPPSAVQDRRGCLTAIRLYAAAASRALATGRPELARQALARMSLQVDRAQALFAAARPDAAGCPPTWPPWLFHSN